MILKYSNYIKENKTYIYNLIDKDFINVFKKYVDKNDYKVVDDKITSYINLDNEYDMSLKMYKTLNKDKIIITKYEDIFNYTPEQYVDYFGYEGFNSSDDAVEYLTEILNTDFPLGLKNIPNEVKLYRVLFVSDPTNIKIKDFGYHFVSYKEGIDDSFLLSIGGENYDWEETPPYLYEVIVNRNDIDFFYTIHNNLLFPREYEITVDSKRTNVKILKYEKLIP